VIEMENDRSGDGVVEFFATGATVTGQYRCAACGYGVTIRGELPACPMCAGESWEATAWSPFTSSAAFHETRGVSHSRTTL